MFRNIRSLLLILFLSLSLAFNIALVTSTIAFKTLSSAVAAVTGFKGSIARSIDEASTLSADLDSERKLNRKMKAELADAQQEVLIERKAKREINSQLAESTAELAAARAAREKIASNLVGVQQELIVERQAKRKLRTQIAENTAELAAARAAKAKIRSSATLVAKRTSKRIANSAKRQVAVAGAESIPFWGIAAVATATALEINDLCQSMKDMNELQALFDPESAVAEEDLTACGFKVPTKTELLTMAVNAPEQAWSAARDAAPSIEDVTSFEMPDMSLSDVGNSISDTAKSVSEGIADSANDQWNKLSKWWSK